MVPPKRYTLFPYWLEKGFTPKRLVCLTHLDGTSLEQSISSVAALRGCRSASSGYAYPRLLRAVRVCSAT